MRTRTEAGTRTPAKKELEAVDGLTLDGASLKPDSRRLPDSNWDRREAVLQRCMKVHEYARALIVQRRGLLGDELAGSANYGGNEVYRDNGGFRNKEDQVRATETLAKELALLAEQAGISRLHHEELVYQFLRTEFIAPKAFVAKLASWDANSLETVLIDLLLEDAGASSQRSLSKERLSFYTRLLEENSIVGMVTCGLTGQLRAGVESRDLYPGSTASPVGGWYLKGIDNAVQGLANIDRFFDTIVAKIDRWHRTRLNAVSSESGRAQIEYDTAQVKELISLFRQDISLVLLESVMMMGVFALMHSEWVGQSTAVLHYWPRFPINKVDPEVVASAEALQLQHSYMQKALPHLFDKSKMAGAITIPMPITVFDAPFFIKYLGNYFGALCAELDKSEQPRNGGEKRSIGSSNESSRIQFGKLVIICHPDCTTEHEARVRISLSGSDFNLRVDHDRRGRVGLDVGSIGLEKALEVASYPLSPENLGYYSQLVDEKGDFRNDRAARKSRPGASKRFASLTDGERASVLFATFATCGFSLGTRREIPVSHHSRERIRDNWSPEEFAQVVNSLSKALTF